VGETMEKLLTLALILFAAPCFGESYLCIGDKATGFIYYKESNKWDTAKFDVSNNKYLITKSVLKISHMK